MNVYITYDRYEHDEWLSVHHIETNMQRAIKHFKEEDLPDFLEYGPDDCHSFQLQKIQMTKKQYERLCELVNAEAPSANYEDESAELKELLIRIFDEDEEFCVETIFQTDGCSDYWEMLKYYCEENGLLYDDDDEQEEAQERLQDDELFKKTIREYIKAYY